jgi:spore coat polysaccharide biosynthesis protein SpsF
MIQWIIERLRTCQNPQILILATSILPQNDPLAELGRSSGVMVFRGSEDDVLDRYYQCASTYELDHIVRATGDNPFVDPEEVDRLIEFYLHAKLDYAAVSTADDDGFPIGVGVEVLSFGALRKSWIEGQLPHHREHVNEYILEHPELFKQARMPAPPAKRAADLSLTVDTIEQFVNAEQLYMNYLEHDRSQSPPVTWVISYLERQNTHA